MTETVFVTGATGYIAQHIIRKLLESGYNVVGSVRSKEKGQSLKQQLNVGDRFKYEIIDDLTNKLAFENAIKKHPEVTFFLHTASPVIFNVKNIQRDVITPAIEGTTSALHAVHSAAPQVKRFVFTSSNSAISGNPCKRPKVVNESNWTDLTGLDYLNNSSYGYNASKTLAEKALWDFVDKERPKFTVATVNPTYVFGPQAFDSAAANVSLNFSANIVGSLLALKPDDEVPTIAGWFIDVRDVARAHVEALGEKFAGKRLLLANCPQTSQRILDIIRERFPQLRDTLPVGKPEKLPLTPSVILNSDETRKSLGFDYISLEKSVYDTIKQILDARS